MENAGWEGGGIYRRLASGLCGLPFSCCCAVVVACGPVGCAPVARRTPGRIQLSFGNLKSGSGRLAPTAAPLAGPARSGANRYFRACSVNSQSIWIEWDWMGLNPKQVKLLLNFFQSHPIHVYWE
jgi:hypothetical protein